MTEQPQVNTKRLPPHPSAEDLYNFVYNRKERRSHSAAKKTELKQKLWNNYQNQLKQMMKAVESAKKEVADGGEDTTIPEEINDSSSN